MTSFAWGGATHTGQLRSMNQDNLLTTDGATPLIVCDLWEHAYYLDHQNDRKGFLEAWFDAQCAPASAYVVVTPGWFRDVGEGLVRGVGFQL